MNDRLPTGKVPMLALGILAIALGLPMASQSDEPLPWSLSPKWESTAGHRGAEWLIAFSPDGKLAYFDQRSGRIIARDTITWKKTGQLLVNAGDLVSQQTGATSPDGKLRAYATEISDKGKGRWWDISIVDSKTKATLAETKAAHQRQPRLLFSHDGQTLISAAFDAIILWDVPKLQRRRTLGPVNSDPRGGVVRLVLSPDGKTLGVGCGYYHSEDQFWDLTSGKMKLSLGGHGVQVWSLAFSPGGKTLVSSGNDPQLKLWDAETGFNTMSIPLDSNCGHSIRPVAFSPDGKWIATEQGSLVQLFDARTGKPVRTLKGHTSHVNALAFSPDGKQLASASGRYPALVIDRPGEPGEVIVWDLATEKAKHTWKAHPLGATAVAWSPDGTQVATAGGADPNPDQEKNDPARAIFLWDARTGKLVKTIPVEVTFGVKHVAFSPDGKWLVHDEDGARGPSLRILSTKTWTEARRLPAGGQAIAFSKDGSILASVGGSPRLAGPAGQGSIALWDPNTGQCLASQFGHEDIINGIAFHPDGQSVATGGSDRAIWLWNIHRGKK